MLTLARKWLKANVSCWNMAWCPVPIDFHRSLSFQQPIDQAVCHFPHIYRTCEREHSLPPEHDVREKWPPCEYGLKDNQTQTFVPIFFSSSSLSMFFFFFIPANTHHRVVSVIIPTLLAAGFIQSSSAEYFKLSEKKKNTILKRKDTLNVYLQHHIV